MPLDTPRRRLSIPAQRREPHEIRVCALAFFLRGAAPAAEAAPPLLSFDGADFMERFRALARGSGWMPARRCPRRSIPRGSCRRRRMSQAGAPRCTATCPFCRAPNRRRTASAPRPPSWSRRFNRGPSPRRRRWRRAPRALRLRGADLRVAARLPLPADARPFALGCARWGLVVAEQSRLFLQPWGGSWIGVALPGAPLPLAADPRFATVVVVLEGRRIALLDGPHAPAIHALPALRNPLHALMLAGDRVLIADVAGMPGAALPTRFTEFLLTADDPEAKRGFAMRGFDGRALWLDAEDRAFRFPCVAAGDGRVLRRIRCSAWSRRMRGTSSAPGSAASRRAGGAARRGSWRRPTWRGCASAPRSRCCRGMSPSM
jgi:hypothetical protein